MNRDPRDIIMRPVVSEKSYASFDANVYTFIVAPDANKIEIRKAVEEIFQRRVTNVNTINRKGKRKRNRRSGTWSLAPRPAPRARLARRRRLHRHLRELTMAIRKRKPTSPGRRFQSVSDFADVTTDTPEKSLTKPKPKTGGRNSYGRKTARHRGGGHKRRYRVDRLQARKGRRARPRSRRSSTTRTATRASRCCTTATARSATSSLPPVSKVGDMLQSGHGSEIRRRQRDAVALHPGRHDRAQRRVEAGRRRQDGPRRRCRDPADRQGRRRSRRCGCPPPRCAASRSTAAATIGSVGNSRGRPDLDRQGRP